MTEDGVTKTMKLDGVQRKKKEEARGQRKLGERREGGERRARGEEWVKMLFVCFILTMGFGTSLLVSKMINIE